MGLRYLNITLAFLSIAGLSWSQSSHGQPAAGSPSSGTQSQGPSPGVVAKRHRMPAIGWKYWTRNDPTVYNSIWKSKTPLGNAELYIVLALLIGLVTVVIGCWLSDNCWSPEPELLTTLA